MNDFTSVLLVLVLPPALVVFLALVWARGALRIGLSAVVFLVPLAIFAWLLATSAQAGYDSFARLGFVALAVVLLGGAVIGAVLGGVVVLVRNLRRKTAV